MPNKYYCLVSGLVEYTLESDRKGLDVIALRNTIKEDLSDKDRLYMDTLYAFYDVENVINIIKGKSAFNLLGNLSLNELKEQVAITTQESDENPASKLPESIRHIAKAYLHPENIDPDDPNPVDTSVPVEKSLWEEFYKECENSKSPFIREWFEFDATLRNVCAAFTARSNSLPIADQLVGNNEIVKSLSRSSAADFGLRNEIEFIEPVIALLEMKSIIEKEHRLDLIRWTKADDITTFNYFEMGNILTYLVKLNIIHRWIALDRKRGEAMLQQLIKELSDKEILRKAEEKEA